MYVLCYPLAFKKVYTNLYSAGYTPFQKCITNGGYYPYDYRNTIRTCLIVMCVIKPSTTIMRVYFILRNNMRDMSCTCTAWYTLCSDGCTCTRAVYTCVLPPCNYTGDIIVLLCLFTSITRALLERCCTHDICANAHPTYTTYKPTYVTRHDAWCPHIG